MFEVGFTEIVLILGLALLVLGPEKLPGLAQKVGRWTGRARAMARQLRTQLEQEVTIEELARSRPMQPAPPSAETPPPAAATDFSTPEPKHHIHQGAGHPAMAHSIPAGAVPEPPVSTLTENAAIPPKPEQ